MSPPWVGPEEDSRTHDNEHEASDRDLGYQPVDLVGPHRLVVTGKTDWNPADFPDWVRTFKTSSQSAAASLAILSVSSMLRVEVTVLRSSSWNDISHHLPSWVAVASIFDRVELRGFYDSHTPTITPS